MSKSNWKQIRDAYEHSNLSMKDIANKYHVKYGTLRVHKNRYKWQRKSHSNSSQSKHETLHRNNVTQSVTPKIDVKALQKSGLTPKRQMFCLLYLKYYNATKAYKLAYDVSYRTANVNGDRLLVNASIQKEITKIRQHQVNKLHFNRFDVLKKLIEIYNVNPGDYVHFGHETDVDDDGNKYERPYLYFRNQKDVDTSLVDEIKMGQNGPDVKVASKLQVAKLLMQYLSNPINHDIKNDTLVEAFIKGQKNAKNRKK